jgi:hypothetical protein
MCKQHLLVLRIAEDYQHLHAHPHNKHTDKKVTLPNLSLLQDNISGCMHHCDAETGATHFEKRKKQDNITQCLLLKFHFSLVSHCT